MLDHGAGDGVGPDGGPDGPQGSAGGGPPPVGADLAGVLGMESEESEVPVVSRIAAGTPAEVAVLVETAREAVLALAGVALDGCSPGEVAGVLAGVEVVARALGWTQLCHAQAVHRGSLHQVDGHRRPGSMLAHCAQLRPAEGSGRDRMGSALVAFPEFAVALREGRVGMGQVDRLAKAWRNPRVRDELVHLEAQLLAAAEGLSAADFDRVVAQLVLLLDADGAEQRQQSTRRARLVQDPDGGFILDGLFPGEAGVALHRQPPRRRPGPCHPLHLGRRILPAAVQPMPSRPPHPLLGPRTGNHQCRQRHPAVRPPQPHQAPRVHPHPSPRRQLTHPPPRRHPDLSGDPTGPRDRRRPPEALRCRRSARSPRPGRRPRRRGWSSGALGARG